MTPLLADSSCRVRATSRMCSVARPSRSVGSSSARAAPAPAGSWTSAQISPFSACLTRPKLGTSRSVTAVRRSTAAFRISARTTSSVIRALCASRSANWSRAAASGIWAATASIRFRNSRRLSSLPKSYESAVTSIRYSRYGRDAFRRSRYAAPPCRRTNPSGSSPWGSSATLTWNPSVTSSCDDRAAAPWPAASGSKLRTTLDVNRRSSCACCGVRAVPHEATTGSTPRLPQLGEVEVPLDQHGVPSRRTSPSSGAGRTTCGSSSRWGSRASSGTSAAGRVRSPGRQRRQSIPNPGNRDHEPVTEPINCAPVLPLDHQAAAQAPAAGRSPAPGARTRVSRPGGANPIPSWSIVSRSMPRSLSCCRARAPAADASCSRNHAAATSCTLSSASRSAASCSDSLPPELPERPGRTAAPGGAPRPGTRSSRAARGT